jgi:oligopeptide transport system substrate-binding protein
LGEILEALYEDMSDEIVVQLARHFVEAGITDKAVTYLLAAGDRARAFYAFEEAARAYERALVFLREEGYLKLTARTLMKLGLVYQNSFEFERSKKAYDEGLTLWREISATSEVFAPPARRPLKLIRASELPTLDPNKEGDTASAAVVHQLFCGLVEMTHSGELVPAGAASWDVMESGRRYVFHLRQDARWSDGRPVTARDYEFSWKRTLAPGFDSENYHLLLDIRNARDYHEGALADPGEIGARSLDDWTLQVDLEKPVGYFMQLMASVGLPVPRHVVEELGDAWSLPDNLVGNGPFMIDSWTPGAGYTFVRNPHYARLSSGNVSEVHLSQVDAEEISSYYASDRCDFLNLDALEPRKQARLLRRHPEEVHSRYGMRAGCLILNTTIPPLNDVRVRQALAMALDKKQAIRQLGLPRLTPALGGFVPPGIPGHLPDAGLPFAPGQARALLEESGFGSDRRPPTLRIAFDPGFAEWPTVLGRQWSEHLSIRLDLSEMRFSELLQLDHRDDYHLVCTGWAAAYPDPDSFLRIFDISDRSGWRNSEYEKLVESARVIGDQSQRLAMYRQAEEILAREVPIIPFSYGRHDYLVKPWVRNPPTSPLALFLWKDLVLE